MLATLLCLHVGTALGAGWAYASGQALLLPSRVTEDLLYATSDGHQDSCAIRSYVDLLRSAGSFVEGEVPSKRCEQQTPCTTLPSLIMVDVPSKGGINDRIRAAAIEAARLFC